MLQVIKLYFTYNYELPGVFWPFCHLNSSGCSSSGRYSHLHIYQKRWFNGLNQNRLNHRLYHSTSNPSFRARSLAVSIASTLVTWRKRFKDYKDLSLWHLISKRRDLKKNSATLLEWFHQERWNPNCPVQYQLQYLGSNVDLETMNRIIEVIKKETWTARNSTN